MIVIKALERSNFNIDRYRTKYQNLLQLYLIDKFNISPDLFYKTLKNTDQKKELIMKPVFFLFLLFPMQLFAQKKSSVIPEEKF